MAGSEVRSLRIYTRTGDGGDTGLLGGNRVPKTDVRIEAIGTVDELNATIGLCRTENPPPQVSTILEWVQNGLFDVGAELASSRDSGFELKSVEPPDIQRLEASIDSMTATLEPLKNFILPGGTMLAARLHVARTVCRRAERRVLTLHASFPVSTNVLGFLNRLSDWLFVAARWSNSHAGVADLKWSRKED
jgi:cob(I)alamin adenosyltransferase